MLADVLRRLEPNEIPISQFLGRPATGPELALFVEEAPEGFVPTVDAICALGVSRQTVLPRVKREAIRLARLRAEDGRA
jgi:hypothetical protein